MRAARDRAATFDRNHRIHEVPAIVPVADANLRDLAGSAVHWILVAFHTRGCVEHRTEPDAGILPGFKCLLPRTKVSPAGSVMPLPVLCEPAFDVISIGVLNPAGASVGAG
jgi:hypothetical protein